MVEMLKIAMNSLIVNDASPVPIVFIQPIVIHHIFSMIVITVVIAFFVIISSEKNIVSKILSIQKKNIFKKSDE